jgi:hypothetical protein
MRDEPKTDLAYYLGKAEGYRKKANSASEPGLKAALDAVAWNYVAIAREIEAKVSSNGDG